jgi:hypothetical protein
MPRVLGSVYARVERALLYGYAVMLFIRCSGGVAAVGDVVRR